MGSMGSRQGEIKVITPSKKAITYCIGLPAPFQIVQVKGSAPVETKQRRPRFKKSRSKRYTACSDMADRVGFEPTVPLLVHLISSQGRYNHFDTAANSVVPPRSRCGCILLCHIFPPVASPEILYPACRWREPRQFCALREAAWGQP